MHTFGQCIEESQAQVVLVTGAAGMGKSRLTQEFIARLRDEFDSLAVWIGRGDVLRTGSAFGLLGQILRRACNIHEGEPVPVRQEKILTRVAAYADPSAKRRIAEFLGEIMGTPFPDEHSEQLRIARRNPQVMTDQLRRAWLDFLRIECKSQPILIIAEDLHWGDLPTVQFMDAALRDLSDCPWMMLAVARPEVHNHFPTLWDSRHIQSIQLKPLGRKAAERLIRQIFCDEIGADTVDRIISQADGNAFYLEELIRATAERKHEGFPETVVAMVQSRLMTLDEEDRRVLRAASVFGESFWPGGVASLIDRTDRIPQVEHRLRDLVERELLVSKAESRFANQEELAFRHVLLREGAYAMLTAEDQVLGHKLAGEWLEQVGERDARLLAEHFDRGGEPQKATGHYLCAAEVALGKGHLDEVDTLMRSLPIAPRTSSEKSRICRIEMAVCTIRGRPLDAIAIGLEALSALDLDIPTDEGLARVRAEEVHDRVQKRIASRDLSALADGAPLTDPDKRAQLEILTNLLAPANLVRPALFSLCAGIQASISLEYGHADESIYGYMLYGMHLATTLGRYAEAGGFGRLALVLDEKRGKAGEPSRVNFVYGSYAHFLEPLPDVLGYLRKAHETGLTTGDYIYLSYACSHIVLVRLALGHSLAAVDEEIERFLALMERTKVASSSAVQTLAQRMIAALMGRTESLRSLNGDGFDEASFVASLHERGVHFALSWYRAIRIKLAFMNGDVEAAIAAAGDVNALASGTLFYFATDAIFFTGLAAACAYSRDANSSMDTLAIFDKFRALIATWARACPDNYGYKDLLLSAEKARIDGDTEAAKRLYTESITRTSSAGLPWYDAIANERAAQFYRQEGQEQTARKHIHQAISAYEQWEAIAAAARLRKVYADLLLPDIIANVDKRAFARPLEMSHFSLSAVVADVVDLVKPALELTRDGFVAELAADMRYMDSDLEKLHWILLRLLGARALHKSPGVVKLKVSPEPIPGEAKFSRVFIQITDTDALGEATSVDDVAEVCQQLGGDLITRRDFQDVRWIVVLPLAY